MPRSEYISGMAQPNSIEKRRRKLDISACALARAVGTTPAHIARIERGENVPSVVLALAIAEALRVGNVRELFPARRSKAA